MIGKLKPWEFAVLLAISLTLLLLAVPMVKTVRGERDRTSCANNMKQIGLVMKMFAGENRGSFPPLSPVPGNWMMDLRVLYSDYISDLTVLRCPGSPDSRKNAFTRSGDPTQLVPGCVSSRYYNYTGFVCSTDEAALALYTAQEVLGWAVMRRQDLELPMPEWSNSDAAASRGMPVLWDRVPLELKYFPHRPVGINVLHMDGSVGFAPYSHYNNSSNFPATRIAAETFGHYLPDMGPGCR